MTVWVAAAAAAARPPAADQHHAGRKDAAESSFDLLQIFTKILVCFTSLHNNGDANMLIAFLIMSNSLINIIDINNNNNNNINV